MVLVDLHHWTALQTTFEGQFSKLPDELRRLVLQDFADAECSAPEFARRLGGTQNLRGYADVLLAQKRREDAARERSGK